MKEKFVRILSPFSIAIIALLDFSVIVLGYYSIEKIIQKISASTILFIVIEIIMVIICFLTSKEVLKNGAVFFSDRIEFNGIDDNNIIYYDNIDSIETYKDDKASLTKNSYERHSLIIFSLNDDRVITIDIGLTTKKTLNKIADEIKSRIK